MKPFALGDEKLNTATLLRLAQNARPAVTLTETAQQRVAKFRSQVEASLASGETVYGINTGFGFLSNVRIDPADLTELQYNLIRSHACGVGAAVADDIVRALLILRAHTFAIGYSGVSLETLQGVLDFIGADLLPFVPEQGSVGASGDLAPLAHLALGFIGEGRVKCDGQWMPAREALAKRGLKPVQLKPKEGLSLINGTHFMSSIAALVVEEAQELSYAADVIAALSLDAFKGTTRAFDAKIQQVRPQPGQGQVAAFVRQLFEPNDAILQSHKDCDRVQDPYSFRCIPQVHGATRDALGFVKKTVNIELNSVTDNPLCFEDGLYSGGNFHGQPIAMAMDFLGIAVAELGSISERRIEKLTNPAMSGLPAFLAKNSGLNSGYMIPHVVAASLVSENKVLAHPAVVDSIPTSADKEDHVSMGPIAAFKARRISKNVARVLAIEVLSAAQGIDFHHPLQPSPPLAAVYQWVRKKTPTMDRDQVLSDVIEEIACGISQGELRQLLQSRNVKTHEELMPC